MDNLDFFAIMYLNDWYWWDKPFINRINSRSKADKLSGIHDAAKFYKITRNFKKIDEERFSSALELLLNVKIKINEKNVAATVNDLATNFEKTYGKYAISAASKLLWLRYRSPVIIYDLRALSWLKANGYPVKNGSYESYRSQWLSAYNNYEIRIKDACKNLYQVKQYTHAHGIEDAEIIDISSSRWFRERVFDKFLWFNAGGS